MRPSLPPGARVLLTRLAGSPLEAVDEAMSLVPMEAPDPDALGASELLVQVRSAAVGWVDLLMASGQYQHAVRPPYTPGLECTGVVVGAGAEARAAFADGDAVIVDGFSCGPRSLGPYQSQGAFASYVVAPRQALHALPTTLSFDQGAALLSSYETAYHCLVTRGRVGPGETVLIHGASGATGLAAVQVAKRLGATVIATGRSEAKLAHAAAAGADHTILLGFDEGRLRPFRDEVRALTGGRGVDVVHDGVGGDVSLESLRCVRFGARFLIVGWASTPFVADGGGLRGAPRANQLPTHLMMMKGLDVLGCPTAISTAIDPESRVPRLAQVLAWAAEGAITPHVSHTFPLASFREALHAKWRGDITGGCVLHP